MKLLGTTAAHAVKALVYLTRSPGNGLVSEGDRRGGRTAALLPTRGAEAPGVCRPGSLTHLFLAFATATVSLSGTSFPKVALLGVRHVHNRRAAQAGERPRQHRVSDTR